MSFQILNRVPKMLGFMFGASLLASSATAQSFCGGIGDGGAWVGGIAEASDISTAAGPFDTNGSVPANGEMVTLFRVSQTTEIRVEAVPGDGGDTVIDLLNDAGDIVLNDDDSGGGLASRGEITLAQGTYCLLTRGLQGGQINANVRVGRVEHQALTTGTGAAAELGACTRQTITAPLVAGGILETAMLPVTAVNSANQVPYYSFSLNSPMSLTFTASNDEADPVLYLYDEDGTVLAENDDTNGLNSRIDQMDPLPAATYCLGLRALSDGDLPITLEVSEYTEDDFLNSLYSSGETSPPLDGSYPVGDLGELETRLREDVRLGDGVTWYQVELLDGDLIVAEAISVGDVDPTLVIFDDLGREIGRNDDYGDGLDSLVAAPVQPGVYLVGVGQVGDDAAGGRVRLALQRYERAR